MKKKIKKLALETAHFLIQKGAEVFVEDDKAEALDLPPLSEGDPKTIDILMTMGGDGSILRVAHTYTGMSGAISSNFGHLGFMAEVQISELSSCLEDPGGLIPSKKGQSLKEFRVTEKRFLPSTTASSTVHGMPALLKLL